MPLRASVSFSIKQGHSPTALAVTMVNAMLPNPVCLQRHVSTVHFNDLVSISFSKVRLR